MKPTPASAPQRQPKQVLGHIFTWAFGIFFGLALLKFGTPPIFASMVTPPEDAYQLVLNSLWPLSWGYRLLLVVALLGVLAARWRPLPIPRWLVALPLFWIFWQCVAASHTIDPPLTRLTLPHMVAAVTCFYLGVFALGQRESLRPLWVGLVVGFCLVLLVGLQQRFGGLEATRKYFYLYLYPTMKEVSPEYLQKINSKRVFSTLFYPNTLAGVILLLTPPSLTFLWQSRARFTTAARAFLTSSFLLLSLACLYWSGSKGGWLLMVLAICVTLFQFPFPRRYKIALLSLLLVLGVAGFTWRFAGYIQKGATSVGARFDYSRAALQTLAENPFFGTGPGTFGKAYERLRNPRSEPAKLAHNDYLEQASDSGFPGFLAYAGFVIGSLVWIGTKLQAPGSPMDSRWDAAWERLAVFIGLAAWSLQNVIEFGLYVPALAWTAFPLLGWLLARCGIESTSPASAARVSPAA